MFWQHIHLLHLLWLIPPLGIAAFLSVRHSRKMRERFSCSAAMQQTPSAFPFWRILLLLCTLGLLILAAARPCWGTSMQTVQKRGRDVFFVLDVSRSMLAEDLLPNRLERAKLAILDCLEVLEGDRVGLILFAGHATLRCPLTQDYQFFRQTLLDASPDSVGQGGTRPEKALELILNRGLNQQTRQARDILLITDGGDETEEAVQNAKRLGEKGVRIFTIGLGAPEGSSILITDADGHKDFIRDSQGNIVRSALNRAFLQKLSRQTPGGKCIVAGIRNFNLGDIYRSLILTAEKESGEKEELVVASEQYQWFLLPAILLFLLAFLQIPRRHLPGKPFFLGWILLFLSSLSLQSASLRQGNRLLLNGDIPQAQATYEQLLQKHPGNPYLLYNKGVACYQQNNFPEAAKNFQDAWNAAEKLPRPDPLLQQNLSLSAGNCSFRLAESYSGKNTAQAIQHCQEAIRHYQQANDAAPKNPIPHANLLAAEELLKRLQEQQKQEQQKQEQQKQEQQKQEQQKQEQQNQEQQNQEQQNQEQQNQEQQNQEQQKDNSLDADAEEILNQEKQDRNTRQKRFRRQHSVDHDW